jgi:hypothetical protein
VSFPPFIISWDKGSTKIQYGPELTKAFGPTFYYESSNISVMIITMNFPNSVLLFGIMQCNEHLSLCNFDMIYECWCFFVIYKVYTICLVIIITRLKLTKLFRVHIECIETFSHVEHPLCQCTIRWIALH